MDRPRIAAIVSGAAASTAAFTVVSHWQLLGTLAGAALVPIIYTVVSHWSSAGLDEAGKWLRSRLARGSSRQGDDPVEEDATAGEGSSLAEGSRESAGRGRKTQWLLVGPAFAALVLSVYTLASPPVEETVETVVVERVIVEKTVTVTTEPAGTLLAADDGESADPTSGPASGAVSSPGSSTIASDVKTEGGSETTDDTEVAEGSGVPVIHPPVLKETRPASRKVPKAAFTSRTQVARRRRRLFPCWMRDPRCRWWPW